MKECVNAFLDIKTIEDLAKFFNVSVATLLYYCGNKNPQNAYETFAIPKKNGEIRTIYSPNKQLKYMQKKLSEVLYEIYEPKRIAHGFIRGKNIISNAEVHRNKKCILNIDLLDFFNTIHFGRVDGMFSAKPFCFNPYISRILAKLVCYNNSLPQGAPTSPIISNFICRQLDNDLIKLTSKYKILCTRYCDDITFSTKASDLPLAIVHKSDNGEYVVGKELSDIIKKNSFKVNPRKIRLHYRYSRQTVTGLVVNEKVNIRRNRYKEFRAVLYYTYMNGLSKGAKRNNYILENGYPDELRFSKFLQGTINYYKMVMSIYDSKYQKLAQMYNELTDTKTFIIPENLDSLIEKYVYIIENNDGQGTAFYVKDIGLVTCLHNVWDLSKEIDEDKLNKKIEKSSVFLKANEKNKLDIALKQYFQKDDLLVLDILYSNIQGGFELSKENIKIKNESTKYIAVGYPGNAPDASVSIVRDVSIMQERKLINQIIYVVDKPFHCGASGGPVLDKNNKVVGYIDRGNELGKTEDNYSAFSSIDPLLR